MECPCSEIPRYDTVGGRGHLEQLLDLVFGLAVKDVLEITKNAGDNTDYVEVEAVCKKCGKRYELVCEAYHGAGGRIREIT